MTNNEVNVRLRDAIAACLLVIMTARAAVRRKTGISLWDKIMLSLTMLIFRLILSIPDCLFFWWRDKPSLTIIDMDEKQQPVKIYQVQEKDLILFCKTEFGMDFQVDEWKELEANLKKRLQTEEDNRLQLEQWLQQGRASQTPGSTKVATLEFDSRDGWVATILPVQTVPDEITRKDCRENNGKMPIPRLTASGTNRIDSLYSDKLNKIFANKELIHSIILLS